MSNYYDGKIREQAKKRWQDTLGLIFGSMRRIEEGPLDRGVEDQLREEKRLHRRARRDRRRGQEDSQRDESLLTGRQRRRKAREDAIAAQRSIDGHNRWASATYRPYANELDRLRAETEEFGERSRGVFSRLGEYFRDLFGPQDNDPMINWKPFFDWINEALDKTIDKAQQLGELFWTGGRGKRSRELRAEGLSGNELRTVMAAENPEWSKEQRAVFDHLRRQGADLTRSAAAVNEGPPDGATLAEVMRGYESRAGIGLTPRLEQPIPEAIQGPMLPVEINPDWDAQQRAAFNLLVQQGAAPEIASRVASGPRPEGDRQEDVMRTYLERAGMLQPKLTDDQQSAFDYLRRQGVDFTRAIAAVEAPRPKGATLDEVMRVYEARAGLPERPEGAPVAPVQPVAENPEWTSDQRTAFDYLRGQGADLTRAVAAVEGPRPEGTNLDEVMRGYETRVGLPERPAGAPLPGVVTEPPPPTTAPEEPRERRGLLQPIKQAGEAVGKAVGKAVGQAGEAVGKAVGYIFGGGAKEQKTVPRDAVAAPGTVPPGAAQAPGTVPPGVVQAPGTVPPGVVQAPGTVPPGVVQAPGTVLPDAAAAPGTILPLPVTAPPDEEPQKRRGVIHRIKQAGEAVGGAVVKVVGGVFGGHKEQETAPPDAARAPGTVPPDAATAPSTISPDEIVFKGVTHAANEPITPELRDSLAPRTIPPDAEQATVPAMARGGIVTSPTLAMIGEAGPEVVAPLGLFELVAKEIKNLVQTVAPFVAHAETGLANIVATSYGVNPATVPVPATAGVGAGGQPSLTIRIDEIRIDATGKDAEGIADEIGPAITEKTQERRGLRRLLEWFDRDDQ